MKHIIRFFVLLIALSFLTQAFAFTHGIYVTQSTAENKTKLNHLIQQSKKYGIDTFVIDINIPSKRYAANVKELIHSGIHYVARIVIFPDGGTHAQVTNQQIWAKRLALAKYAIGLGAKTIQLDYIRYRAENPAKPEKAKYVLRVVQYFKDQLKPYNVSLQMDIFGIATIKPAHTIGQNPAELATVVDAFCPMVYPSHYEPFRVHAVTPYETILNAVTALKKQISANPQVAIYTYIELYNYRFFLSHEKRLRYINAEMDAARDAGSNGWYVWSPNNRYGILFEVLAGRAEHRKNVTEKVLAPEAIKTAFVNNNTWWFF